MTETSVQTLTERAAAPAAALEPEGSGPLAIAVVGAGVAGLTAAWLLAGRHRVTIFEANDYLGGHTNTVTVPSGPDAGTPVDTGFIVMNHRNYPLLTRLFERLEVAVQDSNMSFSYTHRPTGFCYAGNGLNGLFAQRRNLARPWFLRMVGDILRFFRTAPADLEQGRLTGLSLGDYLDRSGFGRAFIDYHIIPMGAAIWSTPTARMLEFPAESFVAFFRNHALLQLGGRPQWRTVVGGSQTYVRKMMRDFPGTVHTSARVVEVARRPAGVSVRAAGAEPRRFDRVVIAAHADQALAMLSDPSPEERRLLGAWEYQANPTILHTDAGLMPPVRRAWASWNYLCDGDPHRGALCLTYHMNRLQRLAAERDYFVTLNPIHPVPADAVIEEISYTHPVYSFDAIRSRAELPALNGVKETFFCGSYFGHGFHEDAVRSAAAVAERFGVHL